MGHGARGMRREGKGQRAWDRRARGVGPRVKPRNRGHGAERVRAGRGGRRHPTTPAACGCCMSDLGVSHSKCEACSVRARQTRSVCSTKPAVSGCAQSKPRHSPLRTSTASHSPPTVSPPPPPPLFSAPSPPNGGRQPNGAPRSHHGGGRVAGEKAQRTEQRDQAAAGGGGRRGCRLTKDHDSRDYYLRIGKSTASRTA